MKAFAGKLTDDEIKALVAYVRTLKKLSLRSFEGDAE
jgi:mono/diheme cytochrome c family protein